MISTFKDILNTFKFGNKSPEIFEVLVSNGRLLFSIYKFYFFIVVGQNSITKSDESISTFKSKLNCDSAT